jgi:hypothetical protein
MGQSRILGDIVDKTRCVGGRYYTNVDSPLAHFDKLCLFSDTQALIDCEEQKKENKEECHEME